ncbi:MAG: hypothetical protein O3A63_02830, partial [Proteobacteria bacterium]|nr:hypothetical protein [Pseudomonadota bacterium]
FVVQRSATGHKAVFASLSRTSNYIRTSLERGNSIWIAQRQGRAKNGIDLTDPALVKMLGLAHRKELKTFTDFSHHIDIVPVSVCYELDPCDLNKATELFVTQRDGAYQKSRDEDMHSIVQGMLGFKGRVHLKFGESLKGDYPDADSLAHTLDRRIVSGLKVFPTHVEAARLMGIEPLPQTLPEVAEVMSKFRARVEACSEDERPYLLNQYANLIRNRSNFGL